MAKKSSSQPSKVTESERAGGLPVDEPLAGMDRTELSQALIINESQTLALEERIAELEFELEDVGWIREGQRQEFEFTKRNLMRIINWSRIMYLKNPLIGNGVEVKADYVFAQGINIKVPKGDQPALDAFLYHPKNQVELTTTEAMWAKDVRLQTEGNIFFALFEQPKGKPVVIRTIPVEEIVETGTIICNPEDRKEPWYYKRVWRKKTFDVSSGKETTTKRVDYYPDWRYNPKKKPAKIGNDPDGGTVHWNIRIMHLTGTKIDEQQYGLPETYRALPWARATVRDLEDYASIKRALSRFAWKAEMKGGKPAITALRNKLATSVGVNAPVEDNPPPATGATWAGNQGYDMTPIKTAGAQPNSDAGHQIRVMTGTGLGLPDNILAGDASMGALATAKTLDRPTELKMVKRQNMWTRVLTNLIAFSLAKYKGEEEPTEDGGLKFTEAYLAADTLKAIDIDFPPILERDAAGRVAAVISAATLDGKTKAGTMTDKNLVILLLQALGLNDDLDEYMSKLKFDKDDMFEKTEEEKALEKARMDGLLQAGSPGGPQPGPDGGPPPDRQAQGLDKQEPAATRSEIMAKRNRESDTPVNDLYSVVHAQVRRIREGLENGQTMEEALEASILEDPDEE